MIESPLIALEPRADWARAFDKAQTVAQQAVRPLRGFNAGSFKLVLFKASSASGPDEYLTAVYLHDDDRVETSCTCKGGQNGQRCYHAAAALIQTGGLLGVDIISKEPIHVG